MLSSNAAWDRSAVLSPWSSFDIRGDTSTPRIVPSRGRPSLSVCTFTSNAPEMVALALAPWRRIADEIVVAVDDRVARDRLDVLFSVADRVIRSPYVAPLEANLQWLHAECRSDWVMRVDGDEVPSAALIERLEAGGWDEGVTHVNVPRRWLWTGADHVLDHSPWWPDFQLRLVRRGMAGFPTAVHQPPEVAGPGRYLEEPIYHLDLLLQDEQARLAKALRYESQRPGLRSEAGLGQNVGFYVPERFVGDLHTTPVPDADAQVLREVIAAASGSTSSSTEVAGSARQGVELARRDHTVPKPGSAKVDVFDAGPASWIAGNQVRLVVRVENRSESAWWWNEEPPIRVGGKVLDQDGNQCGPEFRAELPCVVEPGSAELVPLVVSAPWRAGPYALEVGIVREGVAWFDSIARHPVEVRRQRRAVISAGISPHRHLGDDLIVRSALAALAVHRPDVEVTLLAIDPSDATGRFGGASAHDATRIVHRSHRVGLGTGLRHVWALRRDARRHRLGRRLRSPAHAEFLDSLASADVLVLLGAGWMTSRYRISQLLPKLAEAEAAQQLGIPIVFESGTIGPFDNRVDVALARRILRPAARVSVRDGVRSRRSALEMGIDERSIIEVPDAATWSPMRDDDAAHAWLQQRGLDPRCGWAVVSLRDPRDPGASEDGGGVTEAVAEVIDALDRIGVPCVFVPHCVDTAIDDRVAAAEVASLAPLVIDDEMQADQVIVGLIRHATVAVGNRFHLALIADAAGVPAVFLATSSFDDQRSESFSGGNVEIVQPAEAVGAVLAAVERGRGEPGPMWSSQLFTAALSGYIDRD
jgi:polysaccharide pyruvyl transferase WcaK-like protein